MQIVAGDAHAELSDAANNICDFISSPLVLKNQEMVWEQTVS